MKGVINFCKAIAQKSRFQLPLSTGKFIWICYKCFQKPNFCKTGKLHGSIAEKENLRLWSLSELFVYVNDYLLLKIGNLMFEIQNFVYQKKEHLRTMYSQSLNIALLFEKNFPQTNHYQFMYSGMTYNWLIDLCLIRWKMPPLIKEWCLQNTVRCTGPPRTSKYIRIFSFSHLKDLLFVNWMSTAFPCSYKSIDKYNFQAVSLFAGTIYTPIEQRILKKKNTNLVPIQTPFAPNAKAAT